jgi:hypothetical protein
MSMVSIGFGVGFGREWIKDWRSLYLYFVTYHESNVKLNNKPIIRIHMFVHEGKEWYSEKMDVE